MGLFAPDHSDKAGDSYPQWFAGCGMLVAGGFCYGMLLDESCIARESQNSPDSCACLRPAPQHLGISLHEIRQHEKLKQLADRVFVDPRKEEGVGGLLWTGLLWAGVGCMRGSEQVGP